MRCNTTVNEVLSLRGTFLLSLTGMANIDGIASLHVTLYTTCDLTILSKDDLGERKQVLNIVVVKMI